MWAFLGIGRTGTFCAVDIAIARLQAGSHRVAASAAELKPIVAELRRQRVGMVQTPEQYSFCYQVRSRALCLRHSKCMANLPWLLAVADCSSDGGSGLRCPVNFAASQRHLQRPGLP